ncbi:pirin family protein, partial [Xanthomonas perforans]
MTRTLRFTPRTRPGHRACEARAHVINSARPRMTTLIAPRVHDIGGLEVRRAVPTLQARSVGPFVFVDHMGPAVLEPDHGIDVRPHPHIGLATV